jgi:hypothetical protein
MVPLLRKAIDESKDAEQLLRAQSTLAQLTTGNFEATVAKFLSGKDDGSSFDGWLTVEATLERYACRTRDLYPDSTCPS